MAEKRTARSCPSRTGDAARVLVGLIWLAGAVFNAIVTLRMTDPFAWLETSPIRPYRWFFRDVVGTRPRVWTVLLVVGESGLAALTLARRGWSKLGLLSGALVSAFLFASGTTYTLMMGPYAVLLAWLARREFPESVVEWACAVFRHHDSD